MTRSRMFPMATDKRQTIYIALSYGPALRPKRVIYGLI